MCDHSSLVLHFCEVFFRLEVHEGLDFSPIQFSLHSFWWTVYCKFVETQFADKVSSTEFLSGYRPSSSSPYRKVFDGRAQSFMASGCPLGTFEPTQKESAHTWSVRVFQTMSLRGSMPLRFID